jgi:hypothetical protein
MDAALRGLARERELIAFVVLAVVLSWAWWVPVALAGGTASHFPGLLGSLMAAVVVTATTGGLPGLRRLRGRLGAPRWWPSPCHRCSSARSPSRFPARQAMAPRWARWRTCRGCLRGRGRACS